MILDRSADQSIAFVVRDLLASTLRESIQFNSPTSVVGFLIETRTVLWTPPLLSVDSCLLALVFALHIYWLWHAYQVAKKLLGNFSQLTVWTWHNAIPSSWSLILSIYVCVYMYIWITTRTYRLLSIYNILSPFIRMHKQFLRTFMFSIGLIDNIYIGETWMNRRINELKYALFIATL